MSVENVMEYRKSNKTLEERILIQMTKLVKLCYEEGYNDETLDPSRQIIKEMRQYMNVFRVANGMVEYKHMEGI